MITFNDKPDQANIIRLNGIGQSYDGGKHWIIKGLDLIVEDKPNQGQFVIILGMSGCGKSTLLRYIAGLQKPTEGLVYVNEKLVDQNTRISMVFQQYSSLPWLTVLENVALSLQFKGVPKKEREEQAMEMIKMVGLEGHQHKYAMYPTLSGGQLQRVAIARSLVANPTILLMDEPFGALDVKTRMQMQDLLIQLWDIFHSTILFVTHYISEAAFLGDDIYIMKSAPSSFAAHIPIDLPIKRNRETKRDPHYTELVHYVEDQMMKVSELH